MPVVVPSSTTQRQYDASCVRCQYVPAKCRHRRPRVTCNASTVRDRDVDVMLCQGALYHIQRYVCCMVVCGTLSAFCRTYVLFHVTSTCMFSTRGRMPTLRGHSNDASDVRKHRCQGMRPRAILTHIDVTQMRARTYRRVWYMHTMRVHACARSDWCTPTRRGRLNP